MTPVKIVLGFVGMFTVLMVFAMTRIPADEPVPVKDEASFDNAWSDTMNPLKIAALKTGALRKADREKEIIGADPKPVMTERIIPDGRSGVPALEAERGNQANVETPQAERPKEQKRQNHFRRTAVTRQTEVKSDVCTRHKMHKVYINGGRKWRCRK